MDSYPQPTHFLLHISDTHFVGRDGRLFNAIDSASNLERLFQEFDQASVHPEALIFSGDLADRGEPDAYLQLRSLIEPIAQRYQAEIVWVMGNHDHRGHFRAQLLDGDATDLSPIDRVFDINGLRIIALDSSVHGEHWGEITDKQLEWLSSVLSTPSEYGTLLTLHHPPIPTHLGIIREVELRHQDSLAQVVRGSDIRGILAGHLHYNTTSMFAGIPVVVAAATCYTQDLNVQFPGIRGQDGGQSFNLVHVYYDRVVHSTVPLGSFATVYEVRTEEDVHQLQTDYET